MGSGAKRIMKGYGVSAVFMILNSGDGDDITNGEQGERGRSINISGCDDGFL